jgi:hypothetical protein
MDPLYTSVKLCYREVRTASIQDGQLDTGESPTCLNVIKVPQQKKDEDNHKTISRSAISDHRASNRGVSVHGTTDKETQSDADVIADTLPAALSPTAVKHTNSAVMADSVKCGDELVHGKPREITAEFESYVSRDIGLQPVYSGVYEHDRFYWSQVSTVESSAGDSEHCLSFLSIDSASATHSLRTDFCNCLCSMFTHVVQPVCCVPALIFRLPLITQRAVDCMRDCVITYFELMLLLILLMLLYFVCGGILFSLAYYKLWYYGLMYHEIAVRDCVMPCDIVPITLGVLESHYIRILRRSVFTFASPATTEGRGGA